ncbi:AAA family ATPase [Brevibacillus massiliensis]|uniref:AAA family ATPase n=1 Tax=Brevibacillus massiliensis TaxID=1118054 RepID=UPI0002E20DE6|nr:AAA family ATPase [Brevibacillus massiliensis]
MKILFQKLTLKNYKSHRDLVVEFGDLTRITGDNAKGKSSIPEAVSWTLYGTDTFGSKIDPTPIGYDFDEVKAELLLSVDDKQILLGRGIAKGKVQYWINEVPSKATEFDQLVQSLFDKDLFLSLFNPSYFPSLHWETQRKLILQYVTAPANREVFAQLPAAQADKLAELLKKHSLADLEKIHRDNKNKQDKQYIAAQSRTKTLLEQLERLPQEDIDIEATKAESTKLYEKIKEIEKMTGSADENNRKINTLQARIKSLLEQRDRMKAQFAALKDEPIKDTCRTCGQVLQGDAKANAEADKQKRIDQFKADYDKTVLERKELEAQLATLEYIDVSEQLENIRELERKRDALEDAIYRLKNVQGLQEEIEKAKADEAATLASRNESVFILDAIKAFLAKEAELQAAKVQDLFTTLSIRLFKQNKTDGELKPDFEIEMDGKPYRKLSLSESIRAGLELRDVLSQQSGIVAPCFVDNAESITRFTQPNGQLIMCRVVAGQDLKIEMEDEAE